MDAEMERKWALCKAELLKVQASFLTIALWRCKDYEELKKAIKNNIVDLETMAQEYRDEAEKNKPGRN
jgi:hypothetical protein